MKFLPVFILMSIGITLMNCSQDASKPATEANNENHLGTISFEVEGAKEALPFFKEGMLLLHSFEYDDAAIEFRKAQEIDSSFAMAYWGEAMTHNHPLWSANYLDEGRAVLEKFGATSEERMSKIDNEMELEWWNGVEILFGPGNKVDKDKAYAEHMEQFHKKYPDHHEVSAFYALSLLGSVEDGRDIEIYGKGAKIAQSIIDENPKHPGALHYLIHSYDDPDHAHLAVNAANSYSKVAPDAGHALHMPSHIYIALGRWQDVINSNIASFEATAARKEAKDLDNDALNYHALQWLTYAYLQVEEYEKASQLMQDMISYYNGKISNRSKAYMTFIRGLYLVDIPEWDETLATYDLDVSELNISTRTTEAFIRGANAFHIGDKNGLQRIIDETVSSIGEAEKKMMQQGAQMCSNVNWVNQLPTQTNINQARIMEWELRHYLAVLQNEDTNAEKWLADATQLEANTSFMFGPPSVIKPSFELYGQWLLQKGRLGDAKEQFEKGLEYAPGRRQLVKGLKAIAESSNL